MGTVLQQEWEFPDFQEAGGWEGPFRQRTNQVEAHEGENRARGKEGVLGGRGGAWTSTSYRKVWTL